MTTPDLPEVPSWTGLCEHDRRLDIGNATYYALAGSAQQIATRLAEIVEASPGMVVEGNCMLMAGPPLSAEQYDAQLQARAEATAEEYARGD